MKPIFFQPLGTARQLDFLPQACMSLRLGPHACSRCVAACPVGALTLANGAMTLSEGCLGCGRCVSACPSGALYARNFEIAPHTDADGIVLECWKATPRPGQQNSLRIPCLGGLSYSALLELVVSAQGKKVHLVDRGWCADCKAGGGESHPAAAVVKRAGALLEHLGMPPCQHPKLVSRPLPPGLMPPEIPDPMTQKTLSRRGFFSAFLTEAAATVSSSAGASNSISAASGAMPLAEIAGQKPRRIAALTLELAQRAGVKPNAALFPSVAIDTACCNHGICAAACPGGALQRYEEKETCGIVFDPAACLACGMCETVCPEQAVHLLLEGNPASGIDPVKLTQVPLHICHRCNNKFSGGPESAVCPDCAKKNRLAASLFGMGLADSEPTAANLELKF